MKAETSAQKETAARWFQDLRDQICGAFEQIEQDHQGQLADAPVGRFERHGHRPAGSNAGNGNGHRMMAMAAAA